MENGVRWERLAIGEGGPADALLVTYEPGASSSIEGKLMRHAGVEYAYMLEGELTLQLDFDTHVLAPGRLAALRLGAPAPVLEHAAMRRTRHLVRAWAGASRISRCRSQPALPRSTDPATLASAVDVLRAMDGMTGRAADARDRD